MVLGWSNLALSVVSLVLVENMLPLFEQEVSQKVKRLKLCFIINHSYHIF